MTITDIRVKPPNPPTTAPTTTAVSIPSLPVESLPEGAVLVSSTGGGETSGSLDVGGCNTGDEGARPG